MVNLEKWQNVDLYFEWMFCRLLWANNIPPRKLFFELENVKMFTS